MSEEGAFRATLRDRLAAAQGARGDQPAKVLCLIGSEIKVVEVMVLMDDEDYIAVRTEAVVKHQNKEVTENILLHIHIDNFILVELA
tara:strand:- start:1418 stop:1678 length:261 start_codon:yes stop_codon:yes gene_type:complete